MWQAVEASGNFNSCLTLNVLFIVLHYIRKLHTETVYVRVACVGKA
jgi:hypothetical protein